MKAEKYKAGTIIEVTVRAQFCPVSQKVQKLHKMQVNPFEVLPPGDRYTVFVKDLSLDLEDEVPDSHRWVFPHKKFKFKEVKA